MYTQIYLQNLFRGIDNLEQALGRLRNGNVLEGRNGFGGKWSHHDDGRLTGHRFIARITHLCWRHRDLRGYKPFRFGKFD